MAAGRGIPDRERLTLIGRRHGVNGSTGGYAAKPEGLGHKQTVTDGVPFAVDVMTLFPPHVFNAKW